MYKNNNFKKCISLLVSLVLVLGSLSIGCLAYGEDLIEINDVRFPDVTFRQLIKKQYDTNNNGFLDASELTASKTTSMPISTYYEDLFGENAEETIEDLTGIEYFTNVKRLTISGVGLKKLDLSKNKNLTFVNCAENQLTSITVGSLPNLNQFNCFGNALTSLNISGCPNLVLLNASSNKLSSINLTSNTNLSTLALYQNELSSLDLRVNTKLNNLSCVYNHIAELDLSANTNLYEITSEEIGNQWIEKDSYISLNRINVNYSFSNSSRLVSSSLDTVVETEEGNGIKSAYTGSAFVADEVTAIKNKIKNDEGDLMDGFIYKYSVNNPECDDMTVNVYTKRSYYQVNFYLDQTKEVRLDYCLVQKGNAATAPEKPGVPSCKKIVGWSENFQKVTDDMDVYLVWADDHNMVKNINDGNIDIHCTKCDEKTLKLDFNKAYNTKVGDDGFVEIGDINGDKIINAKDFALIKAM